MRVRSVALWAVLGIVASTAAAMAIPVPGRSSGPEATREPSPLTTSSPGTGDQTRFSSAQTLAVDARLGHATLQRTPGTPGETFLFASVVGTESGATSSSPPVNLAIVIDRSGSMKGDRIRNAIDAAVGIVERMREGDVVSIVTFDTQAQVVMPPTRASASVRPAIEAAIRSIRLGGDTCISCGLDEAMAQMNLTPLGGDRVNRLILLSDGATNHGVRDIPGLRAIAARMRDRGCAITTIGVDVDFDERVMTALASESNGHHYFVANATDLPRIFAQELDTLTASVARDAELTVDLEPGVEVEQVFDRSVRREGSRVIIPLGTFSAKQEKTALLKLRIPTDRVGAQTVGALRLTYRDLVLRSDGNANGKLALDVTDAKGADLDPFVAARIERTRTAETLTEVNTLLEQGNFNEARARLAARERQIAVVEAKAKAAASTAPTSAGPRRGRSVDEDFRSQLAAVQQAERNAAPAAPAKIGAGAAAGGFAQPPRPAPRDERADKAARKTNAEAEVDLRF